MGLKLKYEKGQTPLDEEEKEGLLIPTITTQGELNEFEQKNIEEAIQWTLRKQFDHYKILTEQFIKELHKRMYSDVWRWAGVFRKTQKNIGIDSWKISTELCSLLEDAKYWVENNTYPPEEIAIRIKHRIVQIHCFPNGNGRHSRLMADIIIDKIYKQPVFGWGSANIVDDTELRKRYITALKAADNGDYKLLLEFARS